MEAILDFITQNWTFLLILVGSVLVILTLYMLFNIRPSEAKPTDHDPLPVIQKQSAIKEVEPSIPPLEPLVKNGEILQTLVVPTTPTGNEPIENSPVAPVLAPVDPQPVSTPAVEPAPVEEVISTPTPKPKKPLGKYHVMYRASDDKWIVKRENAERIIRILETQKEAISFATIKALTNETTIVIHKKDGKIRKQNYKKSDEA